MNSHNGKPELRLFGTARLALERAGASQVHVSLTHEQDNALALVVLERA
jgi:holo-[acyl-carrier protein] synthase